MAMEPGKFSFWQRHKRKAMAAAVPLWTIFIVFLYQWTRPADQFGRAAYVLKVGALPVT